jgi:hypothetical protein
MRGTAIYPAFGRTNGATKRPALAVVGIRRAQAPLAHTVNTISRTWDHPAGCPEAASRTRDSRHGSPAPLRGEVATTRDRTAGRPPAVKLQRTGKA